MSLENNKAFKKLSTNFEDEYIQTLHERYAITVSPKKEGKHSETFTKVRNGNIYESSRSMADHTLITTMNDSARDHPSKLNRKKLDTLSQNSTYQRAANLSRKRKRQESEKNLDTMSLRKKRKVESIAEKLKISMVDYTSNTQHPVRNVKTEIKEKRNHLKTSHVGQDVDHDKIDKNSNLLHVPGKQIKGESPNQMNLKELFAGDITDASESSPFKGKMSAFEISLLKGKQSSERRKSLEAATLRSSPRLNANVPANPHTVKRSARSLTPSLNEKSAAKRTAKTIRSVKRAKKKLRDRSKSLGAVSPSSIENQLVTTKIRSASKTKSRSLRPRVKEESEGSKSLPTKLRRNNSLQSSSRSEGNPSTPTIGFRLNGSPKLKGLPTVLSLNTLSGFPQRFQGSSISSSIPQGLYANRISGTPPSFRAINTAALLLDEAAAYFPPVSRPSSLQIDHSSEHVEGHTSISDQCESEIDFKQTCETGQNSLHSADQQLGTKVFTNAEHTPSKQHSDALTVPRSDGQRTRRSSSRSSTPSVSPIKTEVLTPCSTPKQSPSPGRCEQTALNKGKGHLFVKYDDVLVRWHDGVFYIGKVLRIDEGNAKCLLRYEDNSEYWSLFKDIHRMCEVEEICCICLDESSKPPNEIVICDHCNQGFHQQCHKPYIDPDHVVDPDEKWYCRTCLFLMVAKVGGALKEGNRAEDLKKMKKVMPYDLESLTWDVQHKSNVEQLYCYCGGPGMWYQKMLQCCRCKQWFHEACLQCTEFPFLIGDSFFIFVCLPCNLGQEYMKRLDVDWADIIHIVLFNMSLDSRRKYFDLKDEVLPFIEENWNMLRMPEGQEFKGDEVMGHLLTALSENKTRFSNGEGKQRSSNGWGLRARVPPPRIQVNLPISDMLTDDTLKKLKIKGRRSKVFIPVESKSVVKKLHESPSRFSAANNHLNRKDDGTFDPVVKKDQTALKSLRKVRLNLPLLDKLIPQTPFSDSSHPFKTEIEQEIERDQAETRKNIWLGFQNQTDSKSGTQPPSLDTSLDGPPVLEKVEPVIPESSFESLPMPEIQDKKKKGRRSSIKGQGQDDNEKGSCRRSSRKVINPPNLLEPTVDKSAINVKKVKSAEGNHFCAYDKLGFAHGFHVLGRRVSQSGNSEFMINWDY